MTSPGGGAAGPGRAGGAGQGGARAGAETRGGGTGSGWPGSRPPPLPPPPGSASPPIRPAPLLIPRAAGLESGGTPSALRPRPSPRSGAHHSVPNPRACAWAPRRAQPCSYCARSRGFVGSRVFEPTVFLLKIVTLWPVKLRTEGADLVARPRGKFAGLRKALLAWFHVGELNALSWAPGTEGRVLGD